MIIEIGRKHSFAALPQFPFGMQVTAEFIGRGGFDNPHALFWSAAQPLAQHHVVSLAQPAVWSLPTAKRLYEVGRSP
jgi:hypothetical protein